MLSNFSQKNQPHLLLDVSHIVPLKASYIKRMEKDKFVGWMDETEVVYYLRLPGFQQRGDGHENRLHP